MTESLFTQDSTGRFTPILLFAPGRGQYDNVVKSLKERAFPFPVFIDRTNEFIRRNDPILADTRFQSFLLDRNNRIVLMAIRCPAMPCRRCSNRHWRICSPTTGNMFPKTDGHDRQTLDFAAVRRRDGRSGRNSPCRESCLTNRRPLVSPLPPKLSYGRNSGRQPTLLSRTAPAPRGGSPDGCRCRPDRRRPP